MSCYVNTVKGPVSPGELGITLMHEHLAELNNSMKRCYADWFNADIFLEKIKPVFQKAKKYGLSTYVDQTAVNMGRDVRFIKRVSESCDVNIVAATGLFFYEESWQIDKPYEEISELFIRDIEEGCESTDIKAGMLKAATDRFGITPVNVFQLKAVARAAAITGIPVTTHTIAADRLGLEQALILEKAGVDLSKVVIGHVGDTNDLDYLEELLSMGVYLGLDRFGLEVLWPEEDRLRNLLELMDRGWINRLIISQDIPFYSDWGKNSFKKFEAIRSFDNITGFTHIFESVLPKLKARGVSEDEIHTLLVKNPARVFHGGYTY